MSDQLRESISALMDGEADELELRRIMSTDNDESVRSTWARYHLGREVMQDNDTGAYRHLDISSQVSMAIGHNNGRLSEDKIDQLESVVAQKVSDDQQKTIVWWRPMAGFAVAASVAMAVIVGVQTLETNATSELASGFPVASKAPMTSRVYPVAGASMQASGGASNAVRYQSSELPGDIAASRAAADLEARHRLERYMLRHTERAVLNNGQGMISFARVASFDKK